MFLNFFTRVYMILAYSASCIFEVFCKKADVCMKVKTKHGLCLIKNEEAKNCNLFMGKI